MSAKRLLLLMMSVIATAAIGVWAYVTWYRRPYYRYGGGHIWLEDHPTVCWNGLLRAPVFQFKVPPFADAHSWRPTPEQVREELRFQTNLSLSEQDISQIIRSCVSWDEQQNGKSEQSGAANG